MARKATVYLDTSIPNGLIREPEERRRTTRRFFEEVLPSYEGLISELTLAEIRATPDRGVREELLELAS